jgi:hypothetical protein
MSSFSSTTSRKARRCACQVVAPVSSLRFRSSNFALDLEFASQKFRVPTRKTEAGKREKCVENNGNKSLALAVGVSSQNDVIMFVWLLVLTDSSSSVSRIGRH